MESQVRELQSPRTVPRPAPVPLPAGAASRMLGLLAEMAINHIAVGELDDARRVVNDALRLLDAVAEDATTDRGAAARARFALGRALLALQDPTGRQLVEDAGTCFEELGDQPSVHAVDAALRTAGIEESPRSFQSRPPGSR
ncbi:MAG TPA: hypothetical protein VLT33_22550 [Labilithrix sp.]|nr:hypothetical protein [Labilithrix sp.]